MKTKEIRSELEEAIKNINLLIAKVLYAYNLMIDGESGEVSKEQVDEAVKRIVKHLMKAREHLSSLLKEITEKQKGEESGA